MYRAVIVFKGQRQEYAFGSEIKETEAEVVKMLHDIDLEPVLRLAVSVTVQMAVRADRSRVN
jgi:hypothetical protein